MIKQKKKFSIVLKIQNTYILHILLYIVHGDEEKSLLEIDERKFYWKCLLKHNSGNIWMSHVYY